MAQHTPGPWAFDGVRVYAPALDETVTVQMKDGTTHEHGMGLIALPYSCQSDIMSDVGTHEANAALITAAPDLLAAAHSTLACIATIRENWPEQEGVLRTLAEWAERDCQAAIAKAEGK